MQIITKVLRETNVDAETGELADKIIESIANVLTSEQTAVLISRISNGDHRVVGTRIFELQVGDDGTPSIGPEVSVPSRVSLASVQ